MPATLNTAVLAKAKKDEVENNFMAVPSCLSSNIAVFERLRAVSQLFSAVPHQIHFPFQDNRASRDTRCAGSLQANSMPMFLLIILKKVG
jgi:hypothetical protein